jgi:hypothetical protein
MFYQSGVAGNPMGGYHLIVWGNDWNNEKIKKIKYIVTLDGRRLMILYQTTNLLKHAGTAEVSVERTFVRAGVQGEVLFRNFGGKRVNKIIDKTKKMLSLLILFSQPDH